MKFSNHPLFWLALAGLVGLFYLLVAAWGYGGLGFPLDDAWIHQTYARNLARSGQLAFVPGVPSAGSTAPLWSLWLSLGYLLNIPFLLWAYALGVICLGLTGWSLARLTGHLFPGQPRLGFWVGLFCVLEWRVVWAAVSGMETILFIWLSVLLVWFYVATVNGAAGEFTALTPGRSFGLGLIGGLLMLTRPEGLGLIGLIGLDSGYRWWRQSGRSTGALGQRWGLIGVGVIGLLIPYVAFHFSLTGQPFPSTFYAKQAEYGLILQTYPLWWRLFGNIFDYQESVQGVFRVVFIGAPALLLPGLVFAGLLTWREGRSELVIIWVWWISFLLLYGLRLPVTYQHGRYQIPSIVWIVLLGLWGSSRLFGWWGQRSARSLYDRVVSRVMALSIGILVVMFVIIGAQAYGRDVRFINSEMVATAQWLDQHIPATALIAAHDIGAIGYFTQRPLIDLAGLVTPAVIDFIRDEPALLEFMARHEADYLVTFPSWYPYLTQQPALKPIYRTQAPWTIEAGGDNMVVYELDWSVSSE